MKKMLNYITNGKGIGIKYFSLFSLLIGILCWFLFSTILTKKIDNNEVLNKFFSKIPTLEIADGRLIEPKNTYVSIPVIEGNINELIINTVPEIPVNLNFASGIYLSSEAAYFKMPLVADDIQVVEWSEVGNRVIDRAALNKGIEVIADVFSGLLSILFYGILWAGYLLILVTTKLFFWVMGYKTVKGQTGRAATLSWIGSLIANFLLLIVSLQLSIPVVFLMATVLSIIFVFIAPKQEQAEVKGHPFFDTVPMEEKDVKTKVHSQEKPIKVSTQKKNLKLVEKPRRQPTKKK